MWGFASSKPVVEKKVDSGKHTTTLLKEIKEVSERFCTLIESGDGNQIAKELYMKDATLLPPDAQPKSGTAEIGDHFNNMVKMQGIASCNCHTYEVGYMSDIKDRVFEISCYSMRNESDSVLEAGVVMSMFEKDGSKWKVKCSAFAPCHESGEKPPQPLEKAILQKTWTSINAETTPKGPIKSMEALLNKWCQLYNDGDLEALVLERYTHDTCVFAPGEFPKLGQMGVYDHLKTMKDMGVEKFKSELCTVVGDKNDQFAFATGCFKQIDDEDKEISCGKFLVLFRHEECTDSEEWKQYRVLFSYNKDQ